MSDVHPATPDKEGMVDEEVGEEAPPETTTTESKTMVDVAGHDIDETQLAVFITFVASIVLLIATGVKYDWSVSSKLCMLDVFVYVHSTLTSYVLRLTCKLSILPPPCYIYLYPSLSVSPIQP